MPDNTVSTQDVQGPSLYPFVSVAVFVGKRMMSACRQRLQCVASQRPALQNRPAFALAARPRLPSREPRLVPRRWWFINRLRWRCENLFFSADWRFRAESLCFDVSSATRLWMWPNWKKWHNFTVNKMFRSARRFLWSRSESRHRHIVIKSAAGLFCSNPSVHHSHLASELPRDKVLGNASISRTGKSDANDVQIASDTFLHTFLSFSQSVFNY